MRHPFLAVALIILVLLGSALILTRPPWLDEAWFANPAISLLRDGRLATTVVADTVGMFSDVSDRTYWQPPLYFLVEAGWFAVAGDSLTAQRVISLIAAAVLLVVFARLVFTLTDDARAAGLAALLLACDFWLLNGASEGRMDALSAAFGYAALLVFVHFLRSENLRVALAAHALFAGAAMTHPNGVVFIAVGFVVRLASWRRFPVRTREVAVTLLPYVAALGLWGTYIARDLPAFKAQFFGNVRSNPSPFANPLRALLNEGAIRYWGILGDRGGEGSVGIALRAIKLSLLSLYGMAVWQLLRFRSTRPGEKRWLALTALTPPLGFTFLIANKSPTYLLYLAPVYALGIALLVRDFEVSGSRTRRMVQLGLPLLLVTLVSLSALRAVRSWRDKDIANAGRCARELIAERDVWASGELAYEVDFSPRLRDGYRLETLRPERGDVLFVGDRYRTWFERLKGREPGASAHVDSILRRLPNETHFGSITARSVQPLSSPSCAEAQAH